ncbi:MAG: hypothetical protein MR274_03515 [Clostridium sp.]|nr:hypothetical protein [Clostridium sp.]
MNIFMILLLMFIIFVIYMLIIEERYNPVKVISSDIGVILIIVGIKQLSSLIEYLEKIDSLHIEESFIIILDNNEVILLNKNNGKIKYKIAKYGDNKIVNQPRLSENILILPLEDGKEVKFHLEYGEITGENARIDDAFNEKKNIQTK